MELLNVQNLSIDFVERSRRLPVVSSVSFAVQKGHILALVGESGCGKSMTCLALTQLLPSGAVLRASSIEFTFKGNPIELIGASNRELRKVRGGGIAYIFQEPSMSLNPVFRVGDQIAESIRLHRPEIRQIRREVVRLLAEVGISEPEKRRRAYPHELSGGMQQRVMIAMALASNPELLVADEPTTALDVTIQAQILELIRKCCRERGMGVILVTHNLGIVSELADEMAVMYAGEIVEFSDSGLPAAPQHPYTRALLAAVPKLGDAGRELCTIPGAVPTPDRYPAFCRFCDRCEYRKTLPAELRERCRREKPDLVMTSSGHFCRCFYPEVNGGE